MGCGVSRLEIEEASRGQGAEYTIVRRRSNHGAVSDSTILNKQLLEMSEENKDCNITAPNNEEIKKKVNEEDLKEDDGDSNDREDEKDDGTPESSIIYPGSPSFREYCMFPDLSADDGTTESPCSGPICEPPHNRDQSENSKGNGRKHEPKKGRLGRRLKNVKNLLSPSTTSGDSAQKPPAPVRTWD